MSGRGRHRAHVRPLVDLRGLTRTVVLSGALASAPVLAAAGTASAATDNGDGTVTVEGGDTVSAIARATGHSTQAVLDRNGLGWSTTIRPGQVIALPGDDQRAVAPSRSDDRPAPPPAAPEAPPAPAPAPDTSVGAAALEVARASVGLPYRSGGTSPTTGFDCSGLVQHAYSRVGVALPRTSAELRSAGYEVSEPRVGDLVLFDDLAHVGIYAGDGQLVDSPRAGRSVSVRPIWTERVSYRRVA